MIVMRLIEIDIGFWRTVSSAHTRQKNESHTRKERKVMANTGQRVEHKELILQPTVPASKEQLSLALQTVTGHSDSTDAEESPDCQCLVPKATGKRINASPFLISIPNTIPV